jgi:hypothetical protein
MLVPEREIVADDAASLSTVFVGASGVMSKLGETHFLLLDIENIRVRVEIIETIRIGSISLLK